MDIRALRGIAILLVLLHHARCPYLPGGFLGVDIFFVISGFLMSGMIDEALATRTFTFAAFYLRRARRLLPAAYATMAVTTLLSPVLLDSVEFAHYLWQLGGALTFVANMVLWRQADYFSAGAALKPLLHMWSLSLEEQYYIAVPVIMALSAIRWRLIIQIALTVLSLGACWMLLHRNPVAAFYLLPTRAWELGFGSACALAVRRGIVRPRPMAMARLGGAAIILLLPFITHEQEHPGAAAIIVCAATALLMIPGEQVEPLSPLLKPLMVVGDRSYSLYLVHWPLFAFAGNVFAVAVPSWVNAGLLLVSFAWAELQYRYVEQRFRHVGISAKSLLLLAAIPIVLLAFAAGSMPLVTTADTQVRQEPIGLSATCETYRTFAPTPPCRSGEAPATMVWGDSFAMAAANGIAASTPGGIIQATKAECGPFLNIAPVNALYTASWARRCIAFNRSVLDYLRHNPQITTVVLSSALAQYVPGAEDQGWRLAFDDGSDLRVHGQSLPMLVASVRQTVEAVRAMNKRVVLFAPPPRIDLDTARCNDRRDARKWTISPYPDCTFSRAEYIAKAHRLLGFVARIEAAAIVPVFDVGGYLCASGRCATKVDGVILYRDSGHLSAAGSRLLGTRMNWGERLARMAS
jgi:peptidoglycan/LPS O-acetylase OafA/YrhL